VKVLLSWLRELCPTDAEPHELAAMLTRQGVKVESVASPWEGLSGVVVARVLEVRDHPNSEKLCLATVDAGPGLGERRVVAGVRNMAPGDLVPYAPPGSRVPALDEPLGERTLRGALSQGMLCSPWELGISPLHLGILVLPPSMPVGGDVKTLVGLDDVVFDIEVKSNRPDLLSVAGVAREAAAATGAPFVPPDASVEESATAKASDVATVEILDLERCPRYLARVVRGVRITPSPLLVQARLTASGMRPISNVVDATNYVMLETGQPMHAFDLALLEGAAIVVRRADEGERLTTLDGVERRLTSEDLVIGDATKAVAIAGVIGSAAAEVSERTIDILLESAHFEKLAVRRSAARLGVQTEASTRFGRGADPEACGPAAARAARLMVEWGGGEVLSGAVDVGSAPRRRVVAVRAARASLLLGDPVTAADARAVFDRLGMSTAGSEDAIDVEVPGHRPDLEIEADLIEEIARVRGYDRIPEELPGARQPGAVGETYERRDQVRLALVRAGLREIATYSFASRDDADLAGVDGRAMVPVANPLDAEQAFLRPSLLPNLVRTIVSNVARGARGVAIFEIGHVFSLPADPESSQLVDEREHAAGVLTGQSSRGYPDAARDFDVFDAKGALEALLDAVSPEGWSLGDPAGPPFHPGRSARILIDGADAGVLGELHPNVAARLDLTRPVAGFELDVTLLGPARRFLRYREISRFPPVRRDLSFLVDADVPAARIAEATVSASDGLAETPILFDLFEGPPLPSGRKNVGYSVEFRAPDRTLTADEVDAAVRQIADGLARTHGAELRSG
jgi:phenylalanyl-tRNA synthetase beta chain